MTREEMETVIRFDRACGDMVIYTADKAVMNRLSKLPAYTKTGEGKQGGQVVSMTFKASKKLLTLRAKSRTMTEEQKKEAGERLREYKTQNSDSE